MQQRAGGKQTFTLIKEARMRVRVCAALCAGAAALLFAYGCDEDDSNPQTPGLTTEIWRGALFDPVMEAALTEAYDSSRFVYELTSNDSFTVKESVGMGFAIVETGAWGRTGATVTFTPHSNTAYGASGSHAVTPRSAYAGEISGALMTIANVMDISDTPRPLGQLVLQKD
jgi:hypothetical protein